MADGGSTYKRCVCTDVGGRRLGAKCPTLRRANHGLWYFQARLADGRQRRKGGFTSQAEAVRALRDFQAEEVAAPTGDAADQPGSGDPLRRSVTTGEWLAHWLEEKQRAGGLSEAGKKIAPTTARGYRTHIDLYLQPSLGEIPLAQLTREDIARLFRGFDDSSLTNGRRLTAASVRRLYATLRAALNAAVKQEHLKRNPALMIDLAPAARPKALVWTDERVKQWRRTGLRPSPVMVWTPAQTGAFLDAIETDPLFALFLVIAFRGL